MGFAAGVFRLLVAHCGFSTLLWISRPVRGPTPVSNGVFLHALIKTFVQRAAGDRAKAVPVFLRVSRSRMRLDCFRGLPFFDNREMIRTHRVLEDIKPEIAFFSPAGFGHL